MDCNQNQIDIDLPMPKFSIASEQSPDNFRIVNLIKYSFMIILSVIAALLLYALISWLAKRVSLHLFIVKMLMMSFIPIISMGFIIFLAVKGMRTVFGSRQRNIKIYIYSFYDDHFEINTGNSTRSFGYDKLKRSYRMLDHIILVIKGISVQFLPPQVFISDHQMRQFEGFIKEKTANQI